MRMLLFLTEAKTRLTTQDCLDQRPKIFREDAGEFTGRRVKQVRFGKLALPRLNGASFQKEAGFRPFRTSI